MPQPRSSSSSDDSDAVAVITVSHARSGFDRLAGWFFGDRSTRDVNNKTALVFVAIIYFLLVAFPVSFLAVSVFQEFTAPKILVLSGLLLLAAYSVFTWIKPSHKAQQV